jgi:hypothetical protein
VLAGSSYEYAIVRVVPRVEREEFLNAGVIVYCRVLRYLEAKILFEPERLKVLFPTLDLEEVEHHLSLIPRICKGGSEAGPIGELPQHERFHWLVAPRSTIIQTSPCHSGLTNDPAEALENLFERLVRT